MDNGNEQNKGVYCLVKSTDYLSPHHAAVSSITSSLLTLFHFLN